MLKTWHVIELLIALCLFMFGGIVLVWYRLAVIPSAPATTVQIAGQPSALPPRPPNEQAFLKVVRSDAHVAPGGDWTIDVQSNAWSKCMADVYPSLDGGPLEGDVAEWAFTRRNASSLSWVWRVPKDAHPGTWTVRVICGTYETRDITDVNVDVQ